MPYLVAVFVLLQIADIYTTNECLRTKKGREGNPAMAWLFARIGVLPGIIIPKLIIVTLIGVAVALDEMPWWGLAGLCVTYVAVVVNNVLILRKAA